MVLHRRLHGVGCHEGGIVAPQQHVVRVGLRVVAVGDGDGETSTARHNDGTPFTSIFLTTWVPGSTRKAAAESRVVTDHTADKDALSPDEMATGSSTPAPRHESSTTTRICGFGTKTRKCGSLFQIGAREHRPETVTSAPIRYPATKHSISESKRCKITVP